MKKEWWSPGSPAPVRLYDQIPTRATTHSRIRFAGKTTFLKFMLAWLITFHQVVVLADAPNLYLFYQGQVYHQPMLSGFMNLPEFVGPQYYPIWALVDLDFQKTRATLITGSAKIWPIQAASPNPAQWESWFKQYGATRLGMPAGWTRQELIFGYVRSPFLPSIPVMSFGSGLSLTTSPLQFGSCTRLRQISVPDEAVTPGAHSNRHQADRRCTGGSPDGRQNSG